MKLVVCNDCGQERPHKAKGLCNACYRRLWSKNNPEAAKTLSRRNYWNHREASLARSKRGYLDNREQRLAQQREYDSARRDEKYAYNREYRQARYEEMKAYLRRWRMKAKYGMTPEDYERIWSRQDGVCAICGNPQNSPARDGSKPLHIDHDHQTGDVRGLLCLKCNTALAYLEDNEWLCGALTYLQRN